MFRTVDPGKYPFEVLVVDNGSTDGTVEILQAFADLNPASVRPFYLTNNTGTTYSRNIALKQARGRCICILDSDVELMEKTIHHLVTRIRSDRTIGVIAPKLTYGNGMLQKSTDCFPTLPSKLYRFFFLKYQERLEHRRSQHLVERDADYAISAFWLFDRDLLDVVGFLDEKIFYAPEDVDYCLRVWKAGLRVCYEPAVSAIHHAQEISRGLRINGATVQHVKGLLYLFGKHGFRLRRPTMRTRPMAGPGNA